MITITLSNADGRAILQRLQETEEPVLAPFRRLVWSIEAELEPRSRKAS